MTWLAGSAVMTHSLGVFTDVFLTPAGRPRLGQAGGSGKVPLLTIWVALVLLLVSVVFFVLLVERLAMLQISRVLAYAGDRGARSSSGMTSRWATAEASRATPAGELPPPRQVVLTAAARR